MKSVINKVVLVTDSLNIERRYDIKHNDSEGYSKTLINKILDAVSEFSAETLHYDSPLKFADDAHKLSDAVVIPAYFGPASPNSKSLVPAICETYGIRYVGADAYTQAVCNDKYLSKLYAASMGLKTGNAVLIRNADELIPTVFQDLNFPVVVKPNFGGGSNGISNDSICCDKQSALQLTQALLNYQGVPIIVEDYLPGYEVQFTFARLSDGKTMMGHAVINLEEKLFQENEIFGLESKKMRCGASMADIDDLEISEIDVLKRIYKSFYKAEVMRIDCRVDKDGHPYLLELSPDCSLSPCSGLFFMFAKNGYTYSQMLESLVLTAS